MINDCVQNWKEGKVKLLINSCMFHAQYILCTKDLENSTGLRFQIFCRGNPDLMCIGLSALFSRMINT